MKKIGVENFLAFNEMTEMDLAPITVLTGPNNSGKSSFTKLLRLLSKGLSKVQFDDPEFGVGKVSKVKNWDNNSDVFILKTDFNIPSLDEPLTMEIYYGFGNNDELLSPYSVIVKSGSETVIAYRYHCSSNIDIADSNEKNIGDKEIYRLNIEFLKNRLYEKKITFKGFGFFEKKSDLDVFLEKRYPGNRMGSYIDDEVHQSYDYWKSDYDLIITHPDRIFKLIVDQKDISESYDKELRELEKRATRLQVQMAFSEGSNVFERIANCLSRYSKSNHFFINKGPAIYDECQSLYDAFEEITNGEISSRQGVEIELSDLGEHLLRIDPYDDYDTMLTEIIDALRHHEKSFQQIEFLSSNRGGRKNFMVRSSDYEIDEIIYEFNKKGTYNSDYVKDFIASSFEILELDFKLDISSDNDVVSFIKLSNSDREQFIGDMGYGYNQLLPILLKICMVEDESSLIIEEPEANLHPNLQSKLADVFLLAITKFHFNLIIETHSEYLIRRLQYLVANRTLKQKDVVIHYFNSNKAVRSGEKKVKHIRINENGSLTEEFGPGFLDESLNQKFELMKLNKSQLN